MRSFKTLTLLIVGVIALAFPMDVVAVSVPCAADAYTTSTDNYTSNISSPIYNTSLFVGLHGTSESRTALEFDISSLPPAGEQIISASLILYATESDALIAVHGTSGNGAIESADFNFTNEIVQFDPVSFPQPAQNKVDVTPFIQAAAAGPHTFVVFQLREMFDQEMNTFESTRGANDSLQPRLEVSTVPIPEPATLALLLISGLALLSRKRVG